MAPTPRADPDADAPLRVIHAGAIDDGHGQRHRPGAVAFRGGHQVWAGPADEAPAGEQRIDLPDRLLVPEMVNAHTHLELTSIGPQPAEASFTDWVLMLQHEKAADRESVRASAAEGAQRAWDAGVAVVGDIGGRSGGPRDAVGGPAVLDALRASPLAGVHFRELLGLGGAAEAEAAGQAQVWHGHPAEADDVRVGLQPHAPYSTGPAVYDAATRAAVRDGLPVCTHLAELLEEAQFVGRGDGAFREFLQSLGRWEDTWAEPYRGRRSPIEWMQPYLERTAAAGVPWLVAHGNYLSDADVELLRATRTSVAYCPIASAYFGHPHRGEPPHRYRDLLAAGVNVCLGTDSIVCQPPSEPQPLGLLPAMRRLHQRDGTDPQLLLRMATSHGLRALHMPDRPLRLCVSVPIDPADATDPLRQALRRGEPARRVEL